MEMQRRQEEFEKYDKKRESTQKDNSSANRAEAAAAAAMPEQLRAELASMGREISGMLERASCIDGVDAAPTPNTTASDASGTQGQRELSDSDSEASDIDVLGMEDEPENQSGSDDEDGEDLTPEEMREYMAALDEQLEEHESREEPNSSSTVPPGRTEETGRNTDAGLPLDSHHIKVDAAEPLELDLHATEHLLASYCAEHHFEPGPASLLLKELGLTGAGSGAGYGGNPAGSLDSMD